MQALKSSHNSRMQLLDHVWTENGHKSRFPALYRKNLDKMFRIKAHIYAFLIAIDDLLYL